MWLLSKKIVQINQAIKKDDNRLNPENRFKVFANFKVFFLSYLRF